METPVAFIGLKAAQFRHPLDQQATQALKQLPGMDLLVRNLLGPIAEPVFYLENISSSLLVGPKQLPQLHQLLRQACAILDVEVPQLYVRQNPVPNAYTLAMRGKQPFIVLHTALLDLLTPAETQAVIAHELGHLKCEHGVYLTLANLILLAAGQLSPWGTILAQGLQTQLMHWLRCAELTCDRAALLVAQDARVVAAVLMKLCGGNRTYQDELNLEAFLEQARAYSEYQNQWGEMFKELQTAQLTHPLPVLRAWELLNWSDSPAYGQLLRDYQRQAARLPPV